MPIYEYECRGCRHRFEALLARHGDAPPACPSCGGAQVEKRFSAFAVTRGDAPSPPGPCGPGGCACCRN